MNLLMYKARQQEAKGRFKEMKPCFLKMRYLCSSEGDQICPVLLTG